MSGWYTACMLQYRCPDLDLVLVESPNIPRMGVGESLGFGARPAFAKSLGIQDHTDMMQKTGSIFKFGVHNINFYHDNQSIGNGHSNNLKIDSVTKANASLQTSDYYEWCGSAECLENQQENTHQNRGIFEAWMAVNKNNPNKSAQQFFDEIYNSSHFCQNPVVPFDHNNQLVIENPLNNSHTFHVDAEKMVAYLKHLVLSRNVNQRFQHVVSNTDHVALAQDGSIQQLGLETAPELQADVYIDCTGFGRVLAKHTHRDFWQPITGFNDHAWVCPTRYQNPETDMICATSMIGEDHGWRFLVNLYHRQGNGYVFNSNISDSQPIGDYLDKITQGRQLVAPRLIKWEPGMHEQSWVKNCVAIGIANWFFDPWDAPVFNEQNADLEDLIQAISTHNNENLDIEALKSSYNKQSLLRIQERKIRFLAAHGLSHRSGPYWDHYRRMAKEHNIDQIMEKILTCCPSNNIYAKIMIMTNADISKWQLNQLSDQDISAAKRYFQQNSEKNARYRSHAWPNAYQWLRKNLFNGATSQEVYEQFNKRDV